MKIWRICAFINAALGLLAMGVALFLQYALGQEPCSLCMMQRLVVSALVLFSLLIVLIHHRYWLAACLHFICFIFTGLGIALAGRQLYLQSLPDELKPSCGPGFDYLVHHMPFLKVLETTLRGTGECAHIQGLILGHSLPFWSTVLFTTMAMVSVIGMKKLK